MFYSLAEKVLNCSSIDFPRTDLDSQVWTKEDGFYFLREEVKNKILKLLDQYPEEDLLQIAREIRIVGSIGTNLYIDDTDLDVHIIPEDFSKWNEERVKEVMDWFEENESIDTYIGKHPIEVYVQLNPNQDLMSAAAYDILEDTWLVGPKLAPLNYDPYTDFSSILPQVRQSVQDADLLIGELKRDVIDYDTIMNAVKHLPKEHQKRLLLKSRNKLEEIERDIQQLYQKRKEWVDARHGASRPNSPEEAKNDVELAKKWKDINALFKFLNRYQYLRIIQDLEKFVEDDNEITPSEVDLIKGIL